MATTLAIAKEADDSAIIRYQTIGISMPDWNTDAQFADVIDERFLGANNQIDSFLSSGTNGKFLIIASKGMGKTLLIRHKRKQIETEHRDYFLIPRNGTADYVVLPNSPTKGLLKLMETHQFWQDLWTISIAVSALLNFPHNISDAERASILGELKRAELPQDIENELVAAFSGKHRMLRSPSSILDKYLQSEIKLVERARAKGLQVLTDLFNLSISSGCAIFIDSFDQAINTVFPDNLEIWCNGQCGLLKAAWELSRHNRHVKIYTTIRQEAYSYFQDKEINNIKGSVLLIEYTQEDLELIFAKAIEHYESLSSVEEFLGVKQIFNGYLHIRENAFDYICRHTTGVPRWLMVIGEAISNARHGRGKLTEAQAIKKQQKVISALVNKISTDLSKDYLTKEMSAFYKGDTPDRFIEGFLSKIGSTVLSIANLNRITEKLVQFGWAGTTHPFCLLFNLGLLGIVRKTPDGTRRQQVFQKPYQFDWDYDCILPKDNSILYLIHPALHNLIQTKNSAFNFNKVRIGDGLPWTRKQSIQVKEETIRLFISYSHLDSPIVSTIATAIEDQLNIKSRLHDIWFDKWKMRAGRWFQDQMDIGLNESDYLILIVSKSSMDSNAVALEWKLKFSEKLTSGTDSVFPFLLEEASFESLPQFLKPIYAYKYDGTRATINRLVDDILYWRDQTP